MAKDAFGAKIRERVNWPVTVALILVALIVVVFPLYMTVRIAVSTSMPTGLEIFTLPDIKSERAAQKAFVSSSVTATVTVTPSA